MKFFISLCITTAILYSVVNADVESEEEEVETVEEDNEEDEGDVSSRRSQRRRIEGRQCQAFDRPGFCRRRSRCKFPTNRLCRAGGSNPIVCCLEDNIVFPTKPSRTTIKQIRTTTRPFRTPQPIRTTTITNVENSNDVDIVFPGCGNRRPEDPNKNLPSRRGGGLFGGNRPRRFGEQLTRNRGIFGISPVIVGGRNAEPYSWPWMVAIFKKTSSRPSFMCGASLISKNYILSAAHCFTSQEAKEPSKFQIKVGSYRTSEGTPYEIESIKLHPRYRHGIHYNDMCLIKVKKEVELGNKVYPVCLPSKSLTNRIISNKKDVTVTGWGDTSYGGAGSKQLQEVNIPIVPIKKCNDSYLKLGSHVQRIFPDGINKLFICAGLKEGGKDSCQGDSGGPLVMEMNDGKFVQLGVVSFGIGCANPGTPGVYTRVSEFTGWIQENTDLGRR